MNLEDQMEQLIGMLLLLIMQVVLTLVVLQGGF